MINVASPYHPQTNGKLEWYHRTARGNVNVFVYHSPEDLIEAMDSFLKYYNYECNHEALLNVVPADVNHDRGDAILAYRLGWRESLAERRLASLSAA